MTTTFRRALAADAHLIHQLLGEMAAAEGGEIKGSPGTILRHGFGPQPKFRAILAFDDDPIGLILYFPEYSTWRGQMGVYVQDVYLRAAARGLGIGRALLAEAYRDAASDADWNPQFVTLMVAHKNTKARGFYGSLGFAQRDRSDPLILAGEGLAALIAR